MKIGILGCSGRMGRELLTEVAAHPECSLSGGVARTGSTIIGTDIGKMLGGNDTGLLIHDDPARLFVESDAVIDFTTPENTLACARLAAKHKKIHIIGTTGMTEAQKAELAAYGKNAVIVFSANMSVGVNLLQGLVEQAARIMGDEYDIEIVEMHHKHKVDAPSGTALALGEAAAKGRNVSLQSAAILSREGITGARKQGTIGFATLRGGDVIGDHTVIFAGEGERIELSHKSSSRKIYAKGAVRAALWGRKQQPGFYNMQDVLGL
jgi:4-hydroxy-tetrahydrodipicolinate reductase